MVAAPSRNDIVLPEMVSTCMTYSTPKVNPDDLFLPRFTWPRSDHSPVIQRDKTGQDFEGSDAAEQRSASEDLEMLEEAMTRRAAGGSDSSYMWVRYP